MPWLLIYVIDIYYGMFYIKKKVHGTFIVYSLEHSKEFALRSVTEIHLWFILIVLQNFNLIRINQNIFLNLDNFLHFILCT